MLYGRQIVKKARDEDPCSWYSRGKVSGVVNIGYRGRFPRDYGCTPEKLLRSFCAITVVLVCVLGVSPLALLKGSLVTPAANCPKFSTTPRTQVPFLYVCHTNYDRGCKSTVHVTCVIKTHTYLHIVQPPGCLCFCKYELQQTSGCKINMWIANPAQDHQKTSFFQKHLIQFRHRSGCVAKVDLWWKSRISRPHWVKPALFSPTKGVRWGGIFRVTPNTATRTNATSPRFLHCKFFNFITCAQYNAQQRRWWKDKAEQDTEGQDWVVHISTVESTGMQFYGETWLPHDAQRGRHSCSLLSDRIKQRSCILNQGRLKIGHFSTEGLHVTHDLNGQSRWFLGKGCYGEIC